MARDTSGIGAIEALLLPRYAEAISLNRIQPVIAAAVDVAVGAREAEPETRKQLEHGAMLTAATALAFLFAPADGLDIGDVVDVLRFDEALEAIASHRSHYPSTYIEAAAGRVMRLVA